MVKTLTGFDTLQDAYDFYEQDSSDMKKNYKEKLNIKKD
jgi:hypothetical protein